jgi:hypothetical protein
MLSMLVRLNHAALKYRNESEPAVRSMSRITGLLKTYGWSAHIERATTKSGQNRGVRRGAGEEDQWRILNERSMGPEYGPE